MWVWEDTPDSHLLLSPQKNKKSTTDHYKLHHSKANQLPVLSSMNNLLYTQINSTNPHSTHAHANNSLCTILSVDNSTNYSTFCSRL